MIFDKNKYKVTYKILFLLSVTTLLFACKQTVKNEEAPILTDEEKKMYLKHGSNIAGAAFVALSMNLKEALNEGGVQNAISYCNLAASPLIDSLQYQYDAEIKRTSLKIRNPENKPNSKELEQLEKYKELVESNMNLAQQVIKDDNKIHFYAPIYTMPLCGNCHGKLGESLTIEDNELIKELYPNDQAIGYETGVWRGMWSITFPAN